MVKILVGDSVERLKELPSNSVDSVVSDPPYGLGTPPPIADVLKAWLAGEAYHASGKGFMGAQWDSFVPGPEIWKEAYRVLKPGGHMVCFFGTRTYDIGCMAIRLAGFEPRDSISWLFGSGYPKSLNISKALDRSFAVEPTVVATRPLEGKAKYLKGGNYNGKSQENETLEFEITKGTSPEAVQWEGWGTALKPGQELIALVRKPFDGTLIENVMRWGTGGLNIGACRVGKEGGTRKGSKPTGKGHGIYGAGLHGNCKIESTGTGRWPANVCHDGSDEVVGDFPFTKSGKLEPHHYMKASENRSMSGPNQGRHPRQSSFGDAGSSSRFFYCAKASKTDRDRGLDNYRSHSASERSGGRKADSAGINNPRAGTRTEGRNPHPTVKPTALMQWLCRLVTPPGGVVLDPFMGSGSTGVAASLEGFQFIGCDISEEYAAIAAQTVESDLEDIRAEREATRKKSSTIFSLLGRLNKAKAMTTLDEHSQEKKACGREGCAPPPTKPNSKYITI